MTQVTAPASSFWSPRVKELQPYVPGEQPRIDNLVKLNTNENPYPPSPLVIDAIQRASESGLERYPDPTSMALREAIAQRHGLEAQQVFVGNGSDEVLAHAFFAFFQQAEPLLFSDITYSFYKVYAQLYGIACSLQPVDDGLHVDVDALAARAQSVEGCAGISEFNCLSCSATSSSSRDTRHRPMGAEASGSRTTGAGRADSDECKNGMSTTKCR